LKAVFELVSEVKSLALALALKAKSLALALKIKSLLTTLVFTQLIYLIADRYPQGPLSAKGNTNAIYKQPA